MLRITGNFVHILSLCVLHLGATRTDDAKELLYARQSIIVHCKAYGLQAIDMVHIEYKGW